MLGGEVPDPDEVPCPACQRPVLGEEPVWDGWHQGDHRWAALPYHRGCAGGILPPAEPSEAMGSCGRCGEGLAEEVLRAAFAALQARFASPKGTAGTSEVVWRLSGREPRVYVAEHFACVIGALKGGGGG